MDQPTYLTRGCRRWTVLTVLVVWAAVALGAAPAARRPVTLVITGGVVVTMDAQHSVLSPGAVAIDGSKIVAVDTPANIAGRYRARDIIHAEGSVVMPGLINTHTHAPMVMYRGLADDLALMDWLQKYIFPAEAKTVSPELVRVGTRLAALEMIQSGTTLYADMYYFEEEIARATKAAGLRGVLGETVIGFPVARREDARGCAGAGPSAFIQEFQKDALIVPAVAPHAMYTLDAATLAGLPRPRAQVRRPVSSRMSPRPGRGEDVAGEIPVVAGGLSRLDWPARARPRWLRTVVHVSDEDRRS